MKSKHYVAGAAALVLAAALAAWRPWLVEHPGVEFTPAPCDGMGRAKPTGALAWLDDTTAEVRMRVALNCGDEIGRGRVIRNLLTGGELILQYEHLSCGEGGRSCAKCLCERELLYRIAGLERREYSIVLKGL
jgi:hypothetical protein